MRRVPGTHFTMVEPRLLHETLAAVNAPRIAYLFTGQGSQYPGMCKSLYNSECVFRDCMKQCDSLARKAGFGEKGLLDVIFNSEELSDTALVQPALYAV